MAFKKLPFAFMAGGAVILGAVLWLWSAQPASAQCGSQASSCKNCHEVQGQDPVNTEGDWHIQHAFIDACVVCHAGNDQAADKDVAHTAMAEPLADVQAACSRCHPSDTQEKAKVYAVALGVEVGTGSGTTASSGDATPAPTAEPPADSGGSTVVVVDDPNIVDYAEQYDQTAGGAAPINIGNLIIGLLLAAIVLGGGAFIFWNERRRRTPKAVPSTPAGRPVVASLEAYPAEVLELVPLIAELNPTGLHALKQLLQHPQAASDLLHGLSKLNPELVQRIRALDRDSRALLLALAGN